MSLHFISDVTWWKIRCRLTTLFASNSSNRFFRYFSRLNVKQKIKHTWFVYFPLLVTTFTNNNCKKCFHGQNLPKVKWRNVNKIHSGGHDVICYVTWWRVTYAYGCTHSEHGGVPRTKTKVREAVKSLIRRLNTCFQLVKKEVSCRSIWEYCHSGGKCPWSAVFHGVKGL